MGQKLHNRVEIWKKQLLDFGKRNRLINFLEGKRNNVTITSPSFEKIENNKFHFNTIESQLCDLGVQVIWYEDHKEMPEILRKIIAPLR